MYVEDDDGRRIICPHPAEQETVDEVLKGKNLSSEEKERRLGFNSDCVCLDCLHQFEADLRDEEANPWRDYPTSEQLLKGLKKLLSVTEKCITREMWNEIAKDWEKDERICPQCSSINVKTVFELIGQRCPKCKEGFIEEIVTGMIC
jgi:hypothetical protein